MRGKSSGFLTSAGILLLLAVLLIVGPGAPAAAETYNASTQVNRLVMEDDFNFEVPLSWKSQKQKDGSWAVSAPPDTDAFETVIIIQKIPGRGTSLSLEVQKLIRQIKAAPDGKVVKQELTKFGNLEAPFILATYTTNDTKGARETFGHVQVILEHGGNFYLISYSGPAKIYAKYLDIFENIMKTWTFRR
ncbi:MAG: hypothetical protein KQJ78_25240 [Deltaproteobacteria bacterium]|nr:hypothetical protein [Deltaproteobacteria bacterium]